MRIGKLLALLTLAALLLLAGTDCGAISGRLVNPEGIVRIVATSLSTGQQFDSTADSAGGFTLESLPPGAYRVTFRKDAGTAFTRRELTVRAGETLRLNVKLEAVQPPRIDGRRAAPSRLTAAAAADLPPLIQQFRESSRDLNAVVLVDDNHGWAVGDTHWDQATRQFKGSILNTSDGGATWTNQDPGVAVALNGLFFLNSSQGWVVGDNGTILRTADGGAHWTQQPAPTSYSLHSVAFTDASNGWAAGDMPTLYEESSIDGPFTNWQAGIWHTADGGQTWSPQTVPSSATLLNRIVFTGANTGFAAGLKQSGYDVYGDPVFLGAIYGTTDGGHTWNEIFATSGQVAFTSLYFTDASNGWVSGAPDSSSSGPCTFHTADGGKTWQQQTLGRFDERVTDLHMLDAKRGYAVGASGIGFLWRTLDGGATWKSFDLSGNSPSEQGFYGVAVTADRVLIVGDRDFTAYSSDPWDACSQANTDCPALFNVAYISPQYVLHDISFTDRNNGWAAGTRSFTAQVWGQEILHTADGGNTWQPQYEIAPPSTAGPNNWLDSIYFTDPLHGWAVGPTWEGSDYKNHNAILHTADGGVTWKEQGTELYGIYGLELTKVQFLDTQNGWALAVKNATSDDIFLAHTTNGGALWSWVDTGLAGTPSGMSFADSLRGCFAAWNFGSWDFFGCTSDGGAHWTKSVVTCPYPSCTLDANAIAFADTLHGWLAGGNQNGGLYQTTDGGAHWSMNTPKSMSNLTFEDIQFPDPSHGWLSGDGGILYQTADAGATWQPVNTGTGANIKLRGLSFPDAQHGWIVGDYGTILSYAGDRNAAGAPAAFATVNAAINSTAEIPIYTNQAAPAAWISIYGANLSATARAWGTSDFVNGKLPTKLDGVSVLVNGIPAYLSYISPGQINAMFQDNGSTGQVSVQVTNSAGSSGTLAVQKAGYSPALFRLSVEQGNYVIAQTTDGMLVGNYIIGSDLGMFSQVRNAIPGEIVTLYGTGFGPTSPALPSDAAVTGSAQTASPVTFTVGGIATAPCSNCWAGMIGPGLYQFNIQVPPNAPTGDLVIVAEVAGYFSQGDSVISVRAD